jgi:hypothetical protein
MQAVEGQLHELAVGQPVEQGAIPVIGVERPVGVERDAEPAQVRQPGQVGAARAEESAQMAHRAIANERSDDVLAGQRVQVGGVVVAGERDFVDEAAPPGEVELRGGCPAVFVGREQLAGALLQGQPPVKLVERLGQAGQGTLQPHQLGPLALPLLIEPVGVH